MPELPKSWDLKTKKRDDGKLDIVGKDDTGRDYRVRITDGPEITEKDVRELKAADRESYPNKENGIREFVKTICPPDEKKASTIWDAMTFDDNEWIAAAEPVIHAGWSASTVGSTWAYRHGYDDWVKTLKEN